MHLSHLMPRKARVALAVAVIALAPALAPPGSQAVIDSHFDTGDGNLRLDADDGADWASVNETRRTDLATGSGDNSFGQGTKEDTPVPSVVSGSIPNNKSDLKTFGVYFEDSPQGRFLHMFWHRVQEPTGTTNMDFEFNQSSTISANNVTPVRSDGDVLVQYDLAQGGTHPEIFVSRWVATGPSSQCEANNATPCWGTRENLTDQDLAVGSINTTAIPANESDGLQATPVSARTFGEATIDFDAVSDNDECEAFAFAYLKSRSSDSFTAAAKDFIAPLNPGINSCGAVKVTKTKKHAAAGGTVAAAGVTFQLKQGATVVASGATDANGVVCFGALEPGNYTVHEVVPAGYHGEADKSVTVDNSASCTGAPYVGESRSFVNTPLTDISVSVNSQVNGGTASTIDCHPLDPGTDASTDANGDGSYSMLDLEPGTYTCTVIVDP